MFAICRFCYHRTYMYMALVGRTLQEHHKYVDSIKVFIKTTSYPTIHKLYKEKIYVRGSRA
jgi:hypothetical protein